MKIAYVLPVYWPAIGGCELHTHELVKRLSRRHSIKVITQITRQEDKPGDLWSGTLIHPLPFRKPYTDNGARVIPLHMSGVERAFLYPFVRYYHRMERLSMAVIRHIFQKKVFGHLKSSDIVHCIHNGASFYAYTAFAAARRLHIPFVFTPLLQTHQAIMENKQQSFVQTGNPECGMRLGNLGAFLHPRAYHDRFWLHVSRKADALITMTEVEGIFFAGEGIPKGRIHAMGVGPLLSEHADGKAFRKRYGIASQPVVLFLGRKHESKGIEEVLRAAPHVWEARPETVFVFVGPKEGNARKIFSEHREKRIIEIDQVDLQEKTNAIDACDILCMPSMNEALGGVFLEAWSLKKPIIACDLPPLRELTGDGKGGFLVNLDPIKIAEKVIILSDDGNLRKRMGAWGKQRVDSRYTWEEITKRVEQVYLNLIR